MIDPGPTTGSPGGGSRPVLFVTGAAGFVGRHLVRLVASGRHLDCDLVAPSSSAVDVTDGRAVRAAIEACRPSAVIHLAYRKDAGVTIVDGSRHVADAAASVDSRLVHVSTDLVFGGRPTPYREDEPPDPAVPYGADKADAERAVAAAHPDAVIVRTSLVYGTDLPSPAQVRLEADLRGGSNAAPMAYFTDEVRCPVHAADLAAALLELSARPDVTGPLHVTGPEPTTRFDLAHRFARHAGSGPLAHAIRASTIADAGLDRPAHLELDVSEAARLGITCRAVSDVMA